MSLSRRAMLASILGSLALLPTAVFADTKAHAKPDPQTQNQIQDLMHAGRLQEARNDPGIDEAADLRN